MKTWSYISEAILAKLGFDISLQSDTSDATDLGFTRKFPVYANEAMTQICAIKPKRSFARFVVTVEDVGVEKSVYDVEPNFICFGSDRCTYSRFNDCGELEVYEAHNEDFNYCGDDHVIFNHTGTFRISCDVRWHTFEINEDSDTMIEAPDDVIDCIPAYVASQIYKIDDEYKASVFFNEWEIALARINDVHFETNTTFKIGGDW